jgi:hypothetical protein
MRFAISWIAKLASPSAATGPVAPATPLEGIYGAATRRTLDDKNPDGWVPAQKITVAEAVRAYTTGAAYASFEEDTKGKLAPGLSCRFRRARQRHFLDSARTDPRRQSRPDGRRRQGGVRTRCDTLTPTKDAVVQAAGVLWWSVTTDIGLWVRLQPDIWDRKFG